MEDKISKLEKRILSEEKSSQQILGVFIIVSALLNIFEAVAKAVLRMKIPGQTELINTYQFYMAGVKLLLVVVLFAICLKRMTRLFFHSPHPEYKTCHSNYDYTVFLSDR